MSAKPADFDPPAEQIENEKRIYCEVLRIAGISRDDEIWNEVNEWFEECRPRKWIEVDPWKDDFSLSMQAQPSEQRPEKRFEERPDVETRSKDKWQVWSSKDQRVAQKKAFKRPGGPLGQARTRALELYRFTEWLPYTYLHGPDDYEEYRTAQQWLHAFGYGQIERR